MNENPIIKRPHTCFHCGNTGVLKFLTQTGWVNEEKEYDEWGNVQFQAVVEHEDWFVFECPVCHKPVIISEYCFDAADYPDNDWEIETRYPNVAVDPEGVPKEIYTAFESAIKTKGIDRSICLLSLRRVLEMICKNENADGKDLQAKIGSLIEKQHFSTAIGDACWIIRQLGNDAAHADQVDVYDNDIDQIIYYIATIINYLYALPYCTEKMKEKIENRKKKRVKE